MTSPNKERVIWSVVFYLGYLAGCGIGGNSTNKSGGSNPANTISHMLDSAGRPTAIFPPATTKQPVVAALFGVHPDATIPNPSQVAQSYESLCFAFQNLNGSAGVSMHQAYGTQGLVSLDYGPGYGTICLGPLTGVGSDENGNPQGFPVILSGAINTLAVYGTFVSGSRFRCVDTTNVSPLSDGSYVRAYYNLSNDSIILGSGTNQLAPTCSINIPPGDDVSQIVVQWLKS